MASETEHVQLAGFDTAAKTDKQNERLVSAFESTYRHATFFGSSGRLGPLFFASSYAGVRLFGTCFRLLGPRKSWQHEF